MKRPLNGAGARLAKVAPGLNHYTQTILYDELWERPILSKRDRSLITLAGFVAMYRPEQMAGHMVMAMENGLTSEEIGEMITHMAFYASWPAAVVAAGKLLGVVEAQEAEAAAKAKEAEKA
jgi:4-carboxymuconolactone decarboxylase